MVKAAQKEKKPEKINLNHEIYYDVNEIKEIRNEKEAKKVIKKLQKSIRIHNYRYYIKNDPLITDAAFDKLFQQLINLEKNYPQYKTRDSPTQKIGGVTIDEFENYEHPSPMLSLKAIHNKQDLKKFYERNREDLKINEIDYTAEPKYDGLAVELIYENEKLIIGGTRGDGFLGENITQNVKTVNNIPLRLQNINLASTLKKFEDKLTFRGEVLINRGKFKKLNKKRRQNNKSEFSNPRNAASGSLRHLNSAIPAKRPLHFYLYELVDAHKYYRSQLEFLNDSPQLGFPVAKQYIKKCQKFEDFINYYEKMKEIRDKIPYEIDGVVFKINNFDFQTEIGVRSRNPRWAIAYKFPPKRIQTEVKEIQIQVGRTGELTPIAILKKVEINGVKIERASLHNYNNILERDIRIGDSVVVERAGDVIPQVVKVVKDRRTGDEKKIHFPQKCPVCNEEIRFSNDKKHARCPNLNCPAQLIEKIVHYCSRDAMNIKGLGKKTVEKLIQNNYVDSIPSLYNLKIEELEELKGFGEQSAQNIRDQIDASKTEHFLDTFLYAIGIPKVGKHLSQVLAKNFESLEKLFHTSEDSLIKIDEIGPEIAYHINSFFKSERNIITIKNLLKIGIKLINPYTSNEKELDGLKFAFTGALNRWTRAEVSRIIEQHGGRTLSSVSDELNFLIKGLNPGSKLDDAKQKDIKILTEAEFISFLKKENLL